VLAQQMLAEQVTEHWWDARVEFDGFKAISVTIFSANAFLTAFFPGSRGMTYLSPE
jgi:hypothetical protein